MKESPDKSAQRKEDHIDLALRSRTTSDTRDERFHYEPVLGAHPRSGEQWPILLAGKQMSYPIWVSSMTGGTGKAGPINTNLARACAKYGLGLGLGSCRSLLTDRSYLSDFDLRPILGDGLPFFANLGIAQVEDLIMNYNSDLLTELCKMLQADGLIIHINPLQEWFQEEGDKYHTAPLDLIKRVLDSFRLPLIIKEVGQGMGPRSLEALLELPLEAIEFGGFGGTNFSKLEVLRRKSNLPSDQLDLIKIGHSASEMMQMCRDIVASNSNIRCKSLIASGGVKSFLDGYQLIDDSPLPAIYGQASAMLEPASKSLEDLHEYIEGQIQGLMLAKQLLKARP